MMAGPGACGERRGSGPGAKRADPWGLSRPRPRRIGRAIGTVSGTQPISSDDLLSFGYGGCCICSC